MFEKEEKAIAALLPGFFQAMVRSSSEKAILLLLGFGKKEGTEQQTIKTRNLVI